MESRKEIIDPLQYGGWDELALSLNGYSFFHSRSWARVLSSAYGYRPYYAVYLKNGCPTAAWPIMEIRSPWSGRKGVALPFSDHCEPLLGKEDQFHDLLDRVFGLARKMKWKTIELRGAGRFLHDSPMAANYNLHVLDLHPAEREMVKRLRSSTRRNINKALKENIEISVDTSIEFLEAFYRLNCLTRKHHGLPPQPLKFFKMLYKHILSENKGIVVLARHHKQTIAGAVFLHFGDTATYKYGASHRDYLSLRPNNLVMWEAIKWYAARGYRKFDMGRSEPDNRGLNQFKNGWGAAARTIAYYRFDVSRNLFIESETTVPPLIHHAFRAMPVPLLRLIGTLAYRHMG